VRHLFDKYGGNLGATGCVSWNFTQKGVIVISNEDEELDEETVMMDALEAGATDMENEGEVFTVYTEPADCTAVAEALEKAGYTFESAQVEMVPNDYIKLTDEKDIQNMEKMLDLLEEDEDVQNVWHNWDQD
jgi:transcriptional/translational regulatory protein YebC/TACO1